MTGCKIVVVFTIVVAFPLSVHSAVTELQIPSFTQIITTPEIMVEGKDNAQTSMKIPNFAQAVTTPPIRVEGARNVSVEILRLPSFSQTMTTPPISVKGR